MQFLALSPQGSAVLRRAREPPPQPADHVRKILALAKIYGTEATARAIADGLAFHAFSCEYMAHLLEVRARTKPPASPISLTRRADLLELELPEADLSRYEVKD